MTRRELILRAGRAGGYSAAFVAMRSMGLLAEPDGQVSAPPDFPPDTGKGTKVVDHRRRHRRPGGGLRAAQSRFRVHGARGAPAAGRPQLEHPRRRQGRVHRRHGAAMRVRPGPLPQRRARTHSLDSPDAPRLLPRAGRGDGSRGQLHPQRVGPERPHVRQAADRAAPGDQRHARPRGRAAGQGGAAGRAGSGNHRAGQGADGRVPARLRRSWRRLPLHGIDARRRQPLCRRRRRRGRGPPAAAAERTAGRRLLAGPAARGAPRHAGGDAAADRRHGSHRRSPSPNASAASSGTAARSRRFAGRPPAFA